VSDLISLFSCGAVFYNSNGKLGLSLWEILWTRGPYKCEKHSKKT